MALYDPFVDLAYNFLPFACGSGVRPAVRWVFAWTRQAYDDGLREDAGDWPRHRPGAAIRVVASASPAGS
jgi:hypothetical protein